MAEYMTDEIINDQTKSKVSSKFRRPSIVYELSKENYWGDYMEGRDGTIYWTSNGLYYPKKDKKKTKIVYYYKKIV